MRVWECRAALEYNRMGVVDGMETFHIRDMNRARNWFNELMHRSINSTGVPS